MPYNKRYRSKSRRKPAYKKRARRNTKVVRINRPFADSAIVKMRYCDTITLNATGAGGGVNHLFCANSIFDPDNTAGGHQVLGFDQYTPIYDHWVVLGARITAKFMVADASMYEYCTLSLCDSAPSVSTIGTFIENKRGSYACLGVASGANNIKTLHCNYSAKKYYNVKDPAAQDKLIGTSSANPTELCYFVASTQAVGSGDPSQLDVLVVIDYIVKWTEPKVLNQS